MMWNILHEVDYITVEETLRSIARSVAPANDAGGMARFVGSLFDSMCEFVAEPGPVFDSMRGSC